MRAARMGSPRWWIGTLIKDFGERNRFRALASLGKRIRWGGPRK